jgi:hypothetical protein
MDGFIVSIFFDVGADKWAEGFKGEEVNLVTEQVFEEEAELDKIVIVFLPGVELYEQVDVTLLALLSPRVRTEEANPPHSMRDEEIVVLADPCHDFVTGHRKFPQLK